MSKKDRTKENTTTENTTTENAAVERKIGYRDVFTQKEYVKVIFSNLISRFGDSIDAIAFTWLVYAITGSASWSAIIFALNMLPTVIVQPFAGALVERMNKKHVMVGSDIVRGLCVSVLAISYVTDTTTPALLVVFTLIISTVEAFCMPASMALIPKILKEEYFEFGTSLNSTASTVMQLIGTAAAGVIIAVGGVEIAILIDAVTFFGSALVTATVHVKEEKQEKVELEVKGYLNELKEGVLYVKNQKVICNIVLMAVICNALIVPFNALQTPLIVDVLGQGSDLLSAINIAALIGLGIGSFLFPYLSQQLNARTTLVIAGCLLGLSIGGLTIGSVAKTNVLFVYGTCMFSTFVIGMSASIMNSVVSVQLMKVVKKDYLARVGSIFNAGACAASPVVSTLVGAITAFVSVKSLFIGFGAGCVILFLEIGRAHV